METNYISMFKKLNNFGIDADEKLSDEEIKNRMSQFRKSLTFNDYKKLFDDLEKYLLSFNVLKSEKQEVMILLLEFIDLYYGIQKHLDEFPLTIKNLYKSHSKLNGYKALMENANKYEFPAVDEFERLILIYLDYLDDMNNDFFIQICSSIISKFNDDLIVYLNREYNGKKFAEYLNRDLINHFYDKILLLNELANQKKNS